MMRSCATLRRCCEPRTDRQLSSRAHLISPPHHIQTFGRWALQGAKTFSTSPSHIRLHHTTWRRKSAPSNWRRHDTGRKFAITPSMLLQLGPAHKSCLLLCSRQAGGIEHHTVTSRILSDRPPQRNAGLLDRRYRSVSNAPPRWL